MKMNMKKWVEKMISSETKKGMPILSFPSIALLGINVSELISSSDMQAKGMQAVAKRTNWAAAVSLMDLSVEAECFGSEIKKSENEIPTIVGHILNDADDAQALEIPKIGAGRTGIYIDAIKKAAELIDDRPIFAGIIGPYSLTGRLCDVSEIMILCYEEPEMVHTVLEKTTQFLINYCLAYKEAGANGVVMAEPLAGLLSPDLCAEFSSKYVKRIVDAVQSEDFAVVYHNCGNAVIDCIESVIDTGAYAYHFGNAINMKTALEKCPADRLIMGNIDPVAYFKDGTPADMKKAVGDLLEECSQHKNFVISSGCDIPPMSKWENVDAFFEAIEEFYN